MFNDEFIKDENIVISKPLSILDQSAHEPDVCMDNHQSAWVVWSERRRDGDMIRTRRFDDEGFGDILDCSTQQGVEFQPAIISLEREEKLLAWVAFRDGNWCIVTRHLQDKQLGDERIIYSNQEGIFRPRLQKGKNGEAWLVCETVLGGKSRLMVSHTQNGSWSEFTQLSTPDASCYRPSLTLGPGDGIWSAYDCYHDGHYQVFVQRLDQPTEPVPVTDNGKASLYIRFIR